MVIKYDTRVLDDALAEFETDEHRLEYVPPAKIQLAGIHDVVSWVVEHREWIAMAIGGGVLRGIGQDLWVRYRDMVKKVLRMKTRQPNIYVSLREPSGRRVLVVNVPREHVTEEQIDQLFDVYEQYVLPAIEQTLRELDAAADEAEFLIELIASISKPPRWCVSVDAKGEFADLIVFDIDGRRQE